MSRAYGRQVENGAGFADDTEMTSMYVYRPGIRGRTDYTGCDENGELLPSMCRQEFTEECDINVLMKRYERTGMLPVNPTREPQYVDFAEMPENLQEAMHVMIEADRAFMTLPANVRREFDNDAVRFVEYASSRDNLDKLREWGLAPAEKEPEPPMRVEVVNNTPTPPEVPPKA